MAVVILSSARTPIGAFLGGLSQVKATQLGAVALAGALARAQLTRTDIDLVLLGQVLTAGVGQAPARQAARAAGLLDTVPAVTINKMCGSGLEALIQGARAVLAGDARHVVVGGMESMSNAPFVLPGARRGLRLGHVQALDAVLFDGLVDAYDGRHMGACAEDSATELGVGRDDQDAYAVRSYERALRASEDGSFAAEIVNKGLPIAVDEGPALVDFAKLPRLRPAFLAEGTITAANASTINDGAAALVLADEATARERGEPIEARLVGWSVHAQAPADFAVAPVGAMRSLFERVGWRPDEVDAFEVNEAFAVVAMAAMAAFDLPAERVNVFGGAVALGHPIGASGARIVVTLLNVLRRTGGRRGVASICIGGGEALALALELV